eukprot:TRINITY_DN6188_c0_g1_i1.p1 TRINITY_DN6188_c0_g1~~TRINITY_DN6188_c0_g1_i1.p1  ORF type:complete len:201 (+),score=52.20 TRINITY_DN6188_c0_g1_i1:38-604(+)
MGNAYRTGCGGIVCNSEGKLLVGRRAPEKKTDVGTWQFPQGGYEASTDGSLMDGIKREVQEELGLDAKLLTFVKDTGVDVSYDFATPNRITRQKGQIIRYFIFHWPDPDLSKLKFDNTAEIEFDKVDWMTWDQLLESVAQVKHAMYTALRKVAEPMINEYLHSLNCGDNSDGNNNTQLIEEPMVQEQE